MENAALVNGRRGEAVRRRVETLRRRIDESIEKLLAT